MSRSSSDVDGGGGGDGGIKSTWRVNKNQSPRLTDGSAPFVPCLSLIIQSPNNDDDDDDNDV